MRTGKKIIAFAAAAALGVSLVPFGASAGKRPPKPEYVIDQAQVDGVVAAVEAATGQPVLSGELSGAAWIGQIPENWNGDLVIWAHGYRGEGTDLTVGPPPEFEYLTEQGFAWAASSYRRNSYDPGIGVRDTKNVTRKMRQLLRKEPGRLDETYLVGASMGGHVTAAAIERYPWLYDGAMPVCGVIGDVELFDFFLDYNLGAAAIAGLEPTFPSPVADWTTTTVIDIKAELSTTPDGAWAGGFDQILGAPSPLTEKGESFKDFVEIGTGGERVTFDAGWYYWHGLADPTGNFFFSLGEGDGTIANRRGLVAQNSDMTYAEEYGFEIDDIVKRQTATSKTRIPWYINQPAPIIKGRPWMPVLTMHTTGDLFVPIEMEQIYAREMQWNQQADKFLVQRAIRDVGHCTFTSAEWQQSYNDLFSWVETGVKPAGEDLVNDISSPSLGCEWTMGEGGSGLRGLLEPCPAE
jgi:pimeloyl-ACP methyl ester carboxylesterase